MSEEHDTHEPNVRIHLRIFHVDTYVNIRGKYFKRATICLLLLTFLFSLQVHFESNTTACIFLIIILHYFHLTTFFWMFVEGKYFASSIIREESSTLFIYCNFAFKTVKEKIYLLLRRFALCRNLVIDLNLRVDRRLQ